MMCSGCFQSFEEYKCVISNDDVSKVVEGRHDFKLWIITFFTSRLLHMRDASQNCKLIEDARAYHPRPSRWQHCWRDIDFRRIYLYSILCHACFQRALIPFFVNIFIQPLTKHSSFLWKQNTQIEFVVNCKLMHKCISCDAIRWQE